MLTDWFTEEFKFPGLEIMYLLAPVRLLEVDVEVLFGLLNTNYFRGGPPMFRAPPVFCSDLNLSFS